MQNLNLGLSGFSSSSLAQKPEYNHHYLLVSAFVPSHQVPDHNRSTSAYPHFAMYQNVAWWKLFLEKIIGSLEVGVDVGEGLIFDVDLEVLDGGWVLVVKLFGDGDDGGDV